MAPQISLDISIDQIYYDGDHLTGKYIPGDYTFEVRAFNMDNLDTGAFQNLIVTIIDPCPTASLTFTSDLALKLSPEVSLTTFLNYSPR